MADTLKQVREDFEETLIGIKLQLDTMDQTMAAYGKRLALVEQAPEGDGIKALEARIERLEAAWGRMGERLQLLEQRMEKSAAWASKVNAEFRHLREVAV